jgi:hypothetical protein
VKDALAASDYTTFVRRLGQPQEFSGERVGPGNLQRTGGDIDFREERERTLRGVQSGHNREV